MEGEIAPSKTYECNFVQHDFVQFGKQHSRYKVQFTVTFFISLAVVNRPAPQWRSQPKFLGEQPKFSTLGKKHYLVLDIYLKARNDQIC